MSLCCLCMQVGAVFERAARRNVVDKFEFSQRELQVAHLLVEGKGNKQIALALHIAERTVEFHLKHIYAKLKVDSRVAAILKLRETAGFLGDSAVDIVNQKAMIRSKQDNLEWWNRDNANVTNRISLAEIIRLLLTYKVPIFIWLLLIFAFLWFFGLPAKTTWKYEREGEHPDEFSVGQVIQRPDASDEMVHGQFGTVPAWPAQPGYVQYGNIEMPRAEHLYLKLRYSKHSASDVIILVYLDEEAQPRAEILPINQGSWEKFVWTNLIDLGKVERGVHSIRFYTDGQVYGVADLDKFVLTTEPP